MVWFGIALFVIGSVWFLFAPGSKSASPNQKSKTKTERASQKKPHRHKNNNQEGPEKGSHTETKRGLKQPLEPGVSSDLPSRTASSNTAPSSELTRTGEPVFKQISKSAVMAKSAATSFTGVGQERFDEVIANEPLNGKAVLDTPVLNETSYHESSHSESRLDSGEPDLNRISLWTTPVSQLTRTQLEMLLQAYFENEGTGQHVDTMKSP